MKATRIFIAAIAATLTLASCQKEATPSVSNRTIKARIQSSSYATKAMCGSLSYATVVNSDIVMDLDDEQSLYLDLVEEQGIADSFSPATKGQLITTTNFSTASVEAYLNVPSSGITTAQGETLMPHYISGGTLSSDGSVSKDGAPCYWVNDVDMYMWCYSGASLSCGNTSANFHYTTPLDMASQNDVVVSYNKLNYTDGVSDFADVRFLHALAGVRFDFRLLNAGMTVKSIEISGVKTEGDCSVAATGGQNLSFTWTNTSNPGTFTLTGLNATNVDQYVPAAGEMFFPIPQQLASGAKITMTFEVTAEDGTVSTKTSSVDIASHEWKAGYTYTYRVKAKLTTHGVIIVPETNTITFTGSKGQDAVYTGVQVDHLTILRLTWDFVMGNSKDGSGKITIEREGKDDITLYYRVGATQMGQSGVRTGESAHEITVTTESGYNTGNSHSGSTVLIFVLQELGISDFERFDIKFTYTGSNNGNAQWSLSNLNLEILENYQL